MDPIPFKESNLTLTAPPGMPECSELPVYRDHDSFMSVWHLTTEEIADIARTGRLCLWVWGGSHPPVALAVMKPAPGEPPGVIEAITALCAEEGHGVSVLSDNPEAETRDTQAAVEAIGDWTSWAPTRFYARTWQEAVLAAHAAMRKEKAP